MRATISVLATLAMLGAASHPARGQSPATDLTPAPDVTPPPEPLPAPLPAPPPLDALPPPDPRIACGGCCCPCAEEDAALHAEQEVARQTLAASLALFVPAYVAGTAYAWTLPHSERLVEATPIVGAIVAAVRADRDNVALLLFSAGVQTIGVLLAIVSATELHHVAVHGHELGLAAGATPGGMAVSAHLRW